MSGHKMSSFHNVWLDISSDTPVTMKMVSETETAVNIPGVIWTGGRSVDLASLLLILDNLGFDTATGQVLLASPAFITLYARCLYAIGTNMHPPPLGVTGSELLRAMRCYPRMDTYPFANTDRRPCRSPYHSEARQCATVPMDTRSPPWGGRCRQCFEVEKRIRRASWCTNAFVRKQCSAALADSLCAFMARPLTYHKIWAMLHTGDITVAALVTRPFAINHPLSLGTMLPKALSRQRLLDRAFPEESQFLRRMLASSRLEDNRAAIRGVYEDGWHSVVGSTRRLAYPNCEIWSYPRRAVPGQNRAIVDNHYVELVRYAHSARVKLVASGIGREFGSARADWFGPAHEMTLVEFIERIRSRPPAVIYGNVTLAASGRVVYPGGIRVGRWFSHLWAVANPVGVVLEPVGPEHMTSRFDKVAIDTVNDELRRGVWNTLPECIDHDLVRRIQAGDIDAARRRRGSAASRASPKAGSDRRRDRDIVGAARGVPTVSGAAAGTDEGRVEEKVQGGAESVVCGEQRAQKKART